jgi:hypothetical protein
MSKGEGRRGPKIDRSMTEQSRFLRYCVTHEITVTIFMATGISFMGILKEFDRKALLLGYRNPEKLPKLIYTCDITMIRADDVLNLRAEFHAADPLNKLGKRARRTSRTKDEANRQE